MNAGRLNTRITIEKRTAAVDAWGSPLPDAWAEVACVWSDFRHQSGSEAIRADAETSTVRASVRIRWRTDIDAGMRIVAGGAIYHIQAVLPDLKGRVFVDLVCERVI